MSDETNRAVAHAKYDAETGKLTITPVPAPAKGEVEGEERDWCDEIRQPLQVIRTEAKNLFTRAQSLTDNDDRDLSECHAAIDRAVVRIDNILTEARAASSPIPAPKGMEEPWEDDVMRRQNERALAMVCASADRLLRALDDADVPYSRPQRAELHALLHKLPSSPSPETPEEKARREAHEKLDALIDRSTAWSVFADDDGPWLRATLDLRARVRDCAAAGAKE